MIMFRHLTEEEPEWAAKEASHAALPVLKDHKLCSACDRDDAEITYIAGVKVFRFHTNCERLYLELVGVTEQDTEALKKGSFVGLCDFNLLSFVSPLRFIGVHKSLNLR